MWDLGEDHMQGFFSVYIRFYIKNSCACLEKEFGALQDLGAVFFCIY